MNAKPCINSLLLLLSLFAFVACMDKDVYNPDNKRQDDGKLTDLNVPDNFLWNTTQQVAVKVSVGNQIEHDYTILIYPQGYTESTLPLTTGTASSNAPYSATITIPASDTLISIVQTLKYNNGERLFLQSTAPIEDGKAVLDFSKAGSKSVQTRSASAITRGVAEDYKKAIELDSSIKRLEEDTKYKVSEGKTFTLPKNINIKEKADIYVGGTLVIPDGSDLNSDSKIIILGEQQLGKDKSGILMCDGDFTIKNGFDIENYGVVDIKGRFTIHNGSDVETHGCVRAGTLDLDANGSPSNDKGNGIEYEIEEGGSTVVDYMFMQKATVEMEIGTYLHIKNELILKNDCVIKGDDDERMENGYCAVVEAGKVTLQNSNNGQDAYIEDGIFLACDNPSTAPKGVIVRNGAKWGNMNAAKEFKITTPGSSCLAGFNPGGNDSGVDPDPEEIATSIGLYSYAFEDLWPYFGDYDMNDLVIEAKPVIYSENNIVTKVIIDGKITALGASKKIAAGIQWDNIPANAVAGIEYSEASRAFTEGLFKRNANNTESGQTYAVIPLFDNGHAFCGSPDGALLGTSADDTLEKAFTVTITMASNSNISPSSLDMKYWNYFITCNATTGKRMEIHLIDKQPTSLFDKSRIGGDVASAGTPFKGKDNFSWAMCITGSFNFPLERNDIRQSFKDFDTWITNPAYEWYLYPIDGKTRQ